MKKILSLVLLLIVISFSVFASSTKKYEDSINEITKQEETLVFNKFDNEDALKLGLFMINKAKKEGKGITVNISKNGQQLFHVALSGTSPDNDVWVKRKSEITNRTFLSSLKVWYMDKAYNWKENFGMTYHEMWGFDYENAAHLGGAFPLTVKNIGCIGVITVSGLAHELDHQFLVDSLKEYLGK